MTREGLIKHWDYVVAFKNEEKIQRYSITLKDWTDQSNPSFEESETYRIKPKPRECWIVKEKACDITTGYRTETYDKAKDKMSDMKYAAESMEIIHMKEVI